MSLLSTLLIGQTNERDSLWHVYHTAETDTAKIRVLAHLGGFYHNRDLDSSALLSRQALEQARAVSFRKGEADALVALSTSEAITGRYDSSRVHISEALSLYEALDDKVGIEDALNNRAGINFETAKYNEALIDIKRIYALAEGRGDYKQLSWILDNLGLVHYMRGDRVSSLRTLFRSLELKDSLRDDTQKPFTHSLLGDVYRDMGQLERAERSYQIALAGYQYS